MARPPTPSRRGRLRRPPPPLLPVLLLVSSYRPNMAQAAIPTVAIDVYAPAADSGDAAHHRHSTILASGASFGGTLPFGTRSGGPLPSIDSNKNSNIDFGRLDIVLPPTDDPYLCDEYENVEEEEEEIIESYQGSGGMATAMLVPRGQCTFERKALSAQRLGSQLVIVRNTLDSRYRLNETTDDADNNTSTTEAEATYDDIIWPFPKQDYDCTKARALIPKELLSFDPLPYNSDVNDALLSGSASDGNLCAVVSEKLAADPNTYKFENQCPSQRCLLTGREMHHLSSTVVGKNETHMEACCAWDVYREMGGDPRIGNTPNDRVVIPAVFVSMEEGYALLDIVEDNFAQGDQQVVTTVQAYERWYPYPNASSFILWTLGVFVTWISCHLSASEYRKAYTVISDAKREGRQVFRVVGRPNNAAQRVEEGAAVTATTAAPPVEADDGQEVQPPQTEEGFEDEPMDEVALENSVDHQQPSAALPMASPDVSASRPVEVLPTEQPIHQPLEAIQSTNHTLAASEAADGMSSQQPSDVAVSELASPPLSSLSQPQTTAPARPSQQHQHLEINMYHVAGFVVFASAALFVLFYFEIYRVVTILYAIGCSGAMSYVIFQPLYRYLATKAGLLHLVQASPCPKAPFGFNFSLLEILSASSGYAIGISWLYIGLTQLDAHENTYYWVVQNIMGLAVCIAFLGIIRLSSMKIATVLLVAVFVYDIFMVFITPLFTKEGESVMVTVATSGGPPEDPDYCEKYPTEGDCRQGDPLPMLLSIPRVNDYRGGSNLLGLGDIVLPGLLIAFAARLDASKRLLKLCTDVYRAEIGGPMPRRPSGSTVASSVDEPGDEAHVGGEEQATSRCKATKQCFFDGYFAPLMIAYGIGLFFAFLAVHLMQTGQPALLYLVPACLGMMVICGKARGELKELWDGSKRIKKCDRIVSSVRSLF